MLEQAIKFKFPKLKNLVVYCHGGTNFSVTFDVDGVHTEEMVKNFLFEFKKTSTEETGEPWYDVEEDRKHNEFMKSLMNR